MVHDKPRKESPMTEQQESMGPEDAVPPAGEGLADEPIPDATDAPGTDAGSARARDWLNQLETMIQEIATQAAPVARQVGAKAAELAAVAATKAGPIAQKAAEVTTDVGQRFAERAQAVAAELRAEDAAHAEGESAAPGGSGGPAAAEAAAAPGDEESPSA
jgi:peptidoglycan hydrolase CwlO-like protein